MCEMQDLPGAHTRGTADTGMTHFIESLIRAMYTGVAEPGAQVELSSGSSTSTGFSSPHKPSVLEKQC